MNRNVIFFLYVLSTIVYSELFRARTLWARNLFFDDCVARNWFNGFMINIVRITTMISLYSLKIRFTFVILILCNIFISFSRSSRRAARVLLLYNRCHTSRALLRRSIFFVRTRINKTLLFLFSVELWTYYCQRAECKICVINKHKQLIWESSMRHAWGKQMYQVWSDNEKIVKV